MIPFNLIIDIFLCFVLGGSLACCVYFIRRNDILRKHCADLEHQARRTALLAQGNLAPTAAFIEHWKMIQRGVYKTAKNSGWWEERNRLQKLAEGTGDDSFARFAKAVLQASQIALIQSEASEALEALRAGNPPDDKIPNRDGMTAELADIIIRCMDFAEGYELALAETIIDKMVMNSGRPKKHGGKIL